MLGNYQETGHGLTFLFPKIWGVMFVYLDESYNLQKSKGKMFISINGFCVTRERALLSHWRQLRKRYLVQGRRVHANDSHFDGLRHKSLALLKAHQVIILSIVQDINKIPYSYFTKDGINFELIYNELLKILLSRVTLQNDLRFKIIIDDRKKKGGAVEGVYFQKKILAFLEEQFPAVSVEFQTVPSYKDILVELADFVSNIWYREYQQNSKLSDSFPEMQKIQIKNPL